MQRPDFQKALARHAKGPLRRGNTPWGFGSGVAGPQSGYAWYFNWDEWRVSAGTAAAPR